MKGQIKIEFVLGIVIFAVIIFYVSSQVSTAFIAVTSSAKLDMLKSKAVTILDIITKDANQGLASSPNNLDATKINTWKLNNCTALKAYDVSGYRLVISNTTTQLLFCGYVGMSRLRTQVIRPIKINNVYGNITLELW